QKNALPAKQNWKDYQYTVYTLFFSAIIIIIVIALSSLIIISNYRKRLSVKQKLIEQLNFIQIVIDSIPHPVYARNKDLDYILHNKSYLDFINGSNKSLLGKYTSNSFVSDSFRQEIHLDHQKAL
ncbi:hypothetical protein, partial [Bacillus cereus group sp. Bce013]